MSFMRYPLPAIKPPADIFKTVAAVSAIMYEHAISVKAEAAGAVLVSMVLGSIGADHSALVVTAAAGSF